MFRIGKAEGSTPEVFGRITALAVDKAGDIYVLDRFAKHIVVFAKSGTLSHVVGRKGSGPGELSDPIGMIVDARQRLWVADPGNGRYSIYDRDGRFLRSYIRPLSSYSVPWQGAVASGDRMSELVLSMDGTPQVVQMAPSEDGLAQEVVSSRSLPQQESSYFELRRSGSVTRAGVPYSPTMSIRLSDSGVWFAINDNYKIMYLGRAGDTTRIIEHEFKPQSVTAKEKREAIADLEWFVKQGGRVMPSRIPEIKPAFSTFFVGEYGYIWVVPTGPAIEAEAAFDVFLPDGFYMGRVISQVTLSVNPPPVIQGTRIYAAARDASGSPGVVVLEAAGVY